MQHGEQNIADHQFIPVLEQTVELRAVALELGTFIEDFSEDALHRHDLAPDCPLTAKFLLQIGRGRQVVRVRVGLEAPVDGTPLLLHTGDNLVRPLEAGPARGLAPVTHAASAALSPGRSYPPYTVGGGGGH